MRASHPFDDHCAIVGGFEAMFARLTVDGAVIPCLRLIKGGKLKEDHTLRLRALDRLVSAVDGERRDRMAGHGGGRLLRVDLKLPLVPDAFANEDYISCRVSP